MNVIVSNKQKQLLDNANIDAIKELNGLFNIDDLINNFKDYFFSRMIIDATSIVDFAKEVNLRKLAEGIGAEKIILLLPPKPEPPEKFKSLLRELGINNFSTKIEDIMGFLSNPNSNNNMSDNTDIYSTNPINTGAINNNINNNNVNSNVATNNSNNITDVNNDNKIVIGFKNVTEHAGSTTLIYLLKTHLEKNFNMSVEAIEIEKSDFKYFNVPGMISVSNSNLQAAINNSKARIILIDMNNTSYSPLCDECLYLVEPSIIKINKLLANDRTAFMNIKDRKVILNKSALNDSDVSVFAGEARLKIYFNVPYVNDRTTQNKAINDLITVMGLNQNGGRGLFGIFH